MVSDLISRAAARDVINTWARIENENVRMNSLHNDLNAIPAVDAVPVAHGRWVISPGCWWPNGNCSICSEQHIGINYAKYCPNCGAKMDGEEER